MDQSTSPHASEREETQAERVPERAPRSKMTRLLLAAPALVVLITFLFWYDTWFGRPLNGQQMTAALSGETSPRETQHALTLLSERIEEGDPAARRWYPQVVALAQNKAAELRLMAAWVMGQDDTSAEFHRTLRGMLSDEDPMVRWNVALALVRFRDASGEPQLRVMLEPYLLRAPASGAIHFLLKPRKKVTRDAPVAQLLEGKEKMLVMSPLAGTVGKWEVQEGARVAAGEAIASLRPGNRQVWEALRGLFLIGGQADLAEVLSYAKGRPGYDTGVREQARFTADAIERREGKSKPAPLAAQDSARR